MKSDHQEVYSRWSALKDERASWVSHWREISTFLLPRAGRFTLADNNQGRKLHNSIYDSTGTRALSILSAGLMAGMTSPARPWFKLTIPDKDLMEFHSVKTWLKQVEDIILRIFASSNTYRVLHTMYEELGAFGTAATIIAEDFEGVIRHQTLTAGEYCLATDYKGEVCTLYRTYQKTVSAVVKRFGLANCSSTVQQQYKSGQLDKYVVIINAIEPREDRDIESKDKKNKAWKSLYFEDGTRGDPSKKGTYHCLEESGFDKFACLAPRWSVRGNDVYGEGPAMVALGDVKQLQHEQLRKAEAIDYMTKPPIQVPTSLKSRDIERFPGGVSFVEGQAQGQGIRTMFDVNLRLDYMLEDIKDVRERVNACFYADLFMMISNSDNSRMTATEVAERHEEKMLMLGHVLERLHNELLDPLIDITFVKALQAGIITQAPRELQGVELKVEYVSVLAQAQKAISTNSIDRFVGNLGAIAQFKPDVLDKFNADEWADIYADRLGVDPQLIIPSEQVALIRKDRAQQQQQMQQSAMANQGADTAQKLGNTPTTGGNAATDIMQALTGYTTGGKA